ncbi:MAG: FRG domain-containing protein [Muricomes sp.]
MSYQTYLEAINSHLKTIYGEYANWTKCIDNYFRSSQYRMNCHYAWRCEDIPVLQRDDIEKMLKEESHYTEKVEELLTRTEFSKESERLKILGIYPDINRDSLYEWLIDKKYLKSSEYAQIKKAFENNSNLIYMIEDLLSTLFMNGFILEFPLVGGVMTQQKGKYYYRGENAFYGSSKPSVYRKKRDERISKTIWDLLDVLRQYECWNFLDQFDAVKHWQASSVNYLALAQHYGLKTQMMDITSNLKTALFFACCKCGRDRKWYPLSKEEIEYTNSRQQISSLGGDSRYGIIYRSPTEINDMKWAMSDEQTKFNIITPIGYQPFMRCSQQYGYMMLVKDEGYDMMQDPLFDKFRIRLDEELCLWIYEEMDKGNAIYPNDDIPDISQYIEPMNSQHIFSEEVFQTALEGFNMDSNSIKKVRKALEREGYSMRSHISYLSDNKLNKINKKYSADIAFSKVNTSAKARPVLILPSDTVLEEKGGQRVLTV